MKAERLCVVCMYILDPKYKGQSHIIKVAIAFFENTLKF